MHYIRLALQAASPEAFVVNDVDLLANNLWSLFFLRTLALVYADCSLYFAIIGNVFKGIFIQVDALLPTVSRRCLEIVAGIR
jgi:hypothetical protein